MMTTNPTVSIILPVYNAGKYLKECVDSILAQTFASYELLILDDGSTDGCNDFLKDLKDERIRLIRRKHNYIATLNYGLKIARGKYIARMDADDRMFPERLAEQVLVLEENSEIAICATYMQRMGGNEVYNGGLENAVGHFAHLLLLGNFIAHPTVMLRTAYIREHGLKYRQKYIYAEDYKLWSEIACLGGRLYVLPKPLLEYRISEGQVSRVHNHQQAETAGRIRNELLRFLINNQSKGHASHLRKLLNTYIQLNEAGLMDDREIYYHYYLIFSRLFAGNE